MIRFRGLSMSYPVGRGQAVLFGGLDLTIPAGARAALLGRNGAGKSTLLGLIAGTLAPTGGTIERQGAVSWPMGFAGGFAADLTGRQNLRFVARIYGADTGETEADVEDFAELGPFLDMPVRTYSAGMRARLAFGLSMALRFDWYLVDEIAAVGDAAFRQKSVTAFRDRLGGAGLIMVSHAPGLLRDFCSSGIVICEGGVRCFDRLDDALDWHEHCLAPG
ncbi:MAG: ABC transporter ATP-binding protein [Paracoccaceae bacterium]